jgi:hypothetical protein
MCTVATHGAGACVLLMWRHVGLSHADCCGTINAPSTMCRMTSSRARADGTTESHMSGWRD